MLSLANIALLLALLSVLSQYNPWFQADDTTQLDVPNLLETFELDGG